ncbi:hypothetical protein ALP06_200256 [Pseudomonas coronafaciens pv. atropurpurea]|nr:hypothetical protein ALP06_200256 [Pseudomonas coronafaciens pv. atropurpurea]
MNAIAPVMGFITCTEPLQAKGNGYDYPILVRIEFERQPDDSVQLVSRGGNTGALIKDARRVNISSHDWDNSGGSVRMYLRDIVTISSVLRCRGRKKWHRSTATARWLGLGRIGRFP